MGAKFANGQFTNVFPEAFAKNVMVSTVLLKRFVKQYATEKAQ